MIELADQVQIPKCNGRSAAQRRVVSGSFLSGMSDAMRCDAMRRLALAQRPAWPLPSSASRKARVQNGQVPNTACDSRDLQYSVPRTNLHISLSTSLIRLVSFVQVRALLQIQIELDPHPYPHSHPHLHPQDCAVPVNVPFDQGSLWSHPIWDATRSAAASLTLVRRRPLTSAPPVPRPHRM